MLKHLSQLVKRPVGVIIILILLFFVPFGIAVWMAKKPAGLDTTNHGKLITPPLDFNQLSFKDLDGDPLPTKLWRGHWILLYVSPFPCEAVCHEKLYYLRQIRTATGKDRDRIERMLLTFIDQPGAKDLPRRLNTDYAGTIQVNVPSEQYFNLIEQLLPAQYAKQQGYIYIVDPHGNMMMIYKPDTPPMNILKDLTHLLEVSQIG